MKKKKGLDHFKKTKEHLEIPASDEYGRPMSGCSKQVAMSQDRQSVNL